MSRMSQKSRMSQWLLNIIAIVTMIFVKSPERKKKQSCSRIEKNALRSAILRNHRDENNNKYVLEPLGHSGLSAHSGHSGLSEHSGHSGHSQRLRKFQRLSFASKIKLLSMNSSMNSREIHVQNLKNGYARILVWCWSFLGGGVGDNSDPKI